MFEMTLKTMLPPLYQQLLSPRILNLKIQETTANCARCVMQEAQGRKKTSAVFRSQTAIYQPDLKCCTYHPFFPNYIVGAVLADRAVKNQSGRTVMERRIQDRQELLPLGVPAPRAYQLSFLKPKQKFGQKKSLLCPYFNREQNQCGFWIFRGSVCTSFFCASDFPQGLEFWDELVKYLGLVEMTVAEMVLEKMNKSAQESLLGFDLIDIKKWPVRQRSVLSLREQKKLKKTEFWKPLSSPREFYLECYRAAQGLSRSEIEESVGQVLKTQEKIVLEKFRGKTAAP